MCRKTTRTYQHLFYAPFNKHEAHRERHIPVASGERTWPRGKLDVILREGVALRQQPPRKRDILVRRLSEYLDDGLKVQVLSSRHNGVVGADVRALYQGQHGPSCPVGGVRESGTKRKGLTKNRASQLNNTHAQLEVVEIEAAEKWYELGPLQVVFRQQRNLENRLIGRGEVLIWPGSTRPTYNSIRTCPPPQILWRGLICLLQLPIKVWNAPPACTPFGDHDSVAASTSCV